MSAHENPAAERRLRDVFLEALEIHDPAARAAFIQSACGSNQAMRRELEELLAGEEELGSFLETPAQSWRPRHDPARPFQGEQPGDRIGRYKLLQEIGEGGCGTVYMAEQEEPVRRRIALKVIKAGMDTKAVIARFEAERQALALMDHPNIARVLDAGATSGGRPYFVMELVRGIRITEYCDQNNLSVRERLELFIKVCHAIQHAHQKGIIHRDIKPSNILVTLHDGVPTPKVIDFGIAKATEQRLTEKTIFTAFQQFVGTPAYMSPEQAEMSGADVDTRSDIYSLGVLLYEMLTGRTPFDGKALLDSGLDAMRRTLREKEPLPPSTRLQTLEMADAEDLTRQRQERLPALVRMIRGDLDWIVMKAVAKERALRYETANALGADIQRYLDGQAILARPPSRVYQAQKFIQRNKILVASSAAILIILASSAAISAWLAFIAFGAETESAYLLRDALSARQKEIRHRLRSETERLAALRGAYNSDMNLIPQALQANNMGRAVELLHRHRKPGPSAPGARSEPDPDFRQWEWRYFWTQARSRAAFALPRQASAVNAIALSPEGRYLASADARGQLKLWDLLRRSEALSLRMGRNGRRAFAFSPRGNYLAAAESDEARQSVIRIWDVAEREPAHEIWIEGNAHALAFSPDGTRVFIMGDDQGIRSWTLSAYQLETLVPAPGADSRAPRAFNAVFSPDARLIAVSKSDGIRVLDTGTGQEKSFIAGFAHGNAAIAFSPQGETLAVGPLFTETETDIKLYDTASGRETGRLSGHASWVPGAVFSADGGSLISAGADQTVRVWSLRERRELHVFRGHLSEVNSVAVSSSGAMLLSSCKDGTIFGWDTDGADASPRYETLPVEVRSMEFFPDGRSFLSVNRDGSVSVWDSKTLRQVERVEALGHRAERALISPDGTLVCASLRGGAVAMLDWPSRAVVTNLVAPGGRRLPMAPIGFLDHGRSLLTVGPENGGRIWNVTNWQSQPLPKPKNDPLFFTGQFAFSPNEKLLAIANFRRGVEIFDLKLGKIEATLSLETWMPSGLAFSPSGSVLALSSRDGTVHLWNFDEDSELDVIRAHLIGVHAVSYSPDGARLASASAKNEAVKLWDTATGHEVVTLSGEGSIFEQVKFSPDGVLLAAINTQGKAHIWRAPPLAEIDEISSAIRP